MRTIGSTFIAGILAIFACNEASAQNAPANVDSGAVVRIQTVDNPSALSARLLRRWTRTDDTLRACRTSGPPCTERADSVRSLHIPADRISSVAVRRGDHGLIGAVIGAGIGAAAASGTHFACDTRDCGSSVFLSALGGIVLGTIGYVIGGHLGHWVTVQ